MLQCIIKCMVIRNQEVRDALETYIKTFDITNFPGKNVPTACLFLKAVAHALGDKDLPTNAIRKVLEGFAKIVYQIVQQILCKLDCLAPGNFLPHPNEKHLPPKSTKQHSK